MTRRAAPSNARPKVADLFCGAGGLSEGFRAAGFDILAGADHDPDACSTYARNFPEAVTVCGDIREAQARSKFLDAAAGADVLVGGPPCQAFSQVRNHDRLLDDPRNSLYREFVRAIEAVLPDSFVMENVPGMEQLGVKQRVLADLSLDGEYVVSAKVLDAADFGVPQTRKRIVFIGVRGDIGTDPPFIEGSGATQALSLVRRGADLPRYEVEAQETLFAGRLLERLADPGDAGLVTAEQALDDLAALVPGKVTEIEAAALPEPASEYQRIMRAGTGPAIANVDVPRINADTVLRLQGIPEGGNYRDLADHLRDRYLTGLKWGPDNGTGRLGRRHYYAYRRLHSAFWSWTLNTKGDSVYHYRALRGLSVREFARLQSFPDTFVFATDPRPGELPGRIDGGAWHSRYRQAGNAVPPLLARAIAAAVAGTVKTRRVRTA